MAKDKKKDKWSSEKIGQEFESLFIYQLYEYMRNHDLECDVFQPLVDDNGIDYVIKIEDGTYQEIQVKGRTNGKPGFTIKTDLQKHNDNYWLVLYYYEKETKSKKLHRYILNKIAIANLLKNGHITIANLEKHRDETLAEKEVFEYESFSVTYGDTKKTKRIPSNV